jgi:replication factor C large subunit
MGEENLTWIKKHCPKKSEEVIAQSAAIGSLKSYILNHKKQKKKAIIIYGPSGCGKTSSVYAIANEMNLEVVELNASDFRNKEQIDSVAGAASRQMSLFMMNKVILIDELDGIAGREDYGGVSALVEVIEKSSWPIVITANNPFDNKFSSIRNKSEMLQYKELSSDDVFAILKRVCDKEKVKYDEKMLKVLAIRSGGDARGAVNDLQIVSSENKVVDEESVNKISFRDKTDTILTALTRILKSTDVNVAKDAFENVVEEMDQRLLWLDENIPKEYTKPEDLARAYDKLSRADVFIGRIRRWQHWRYMTYANDLLTAGVAVSKDERNKEFIAYKPTGRILKLWWAKQKNIKKKAIAEKIASKTHSSTNEIIQNIDYFKVIFKSDSKMASSITKELDLNEDEIEYLKK